MFHQRMRGHMMCSVPLKYLLDQLFSIFHIYVCMWPVLVVLFLCLGLQIPLRTFGIHRIPLSAICIQNSVLRLMCSGVRERIGLPARIAFLHSGKDIQVAHHS